MTSKTSKEIIVVPLDGSESAEQAIPYAEALRGAGDTLLLFEAVSPTGGGGGIFGDIPITFEDELEQLRSTAKDELTKTAERWDSVLGKKPHVESYAGPPVEAIEKVIEDRDASLLVIASSGRGALSRMAFGSVADELTRTSSVPVLIVHPDKKDEGELRTVEFKRIIVPLDGSDVSETALPVAGELARHAKLPVVLVQVINPSLEYSMVGQTMTPMTGELYNEVESDFREQATEDLGRATNLLGDVDAGVTQQILEGGTTEALAQHVEPGDLIVMTSHGRSGFRRMLLGSVAQKIIHDRIAPVVLVRAPETAED